MTGIKLWKNGFTLTTAHEAVMGITALVNLTPHALELRTWDRGIPAILNVPSHGLARIEETETPLPVGLLGWDHGYGGEVVFPDHLLSFGEVTGLPYGAHEVILGELTATEQEAINVVRTSGGLQPLPPYTRWPVRFIVSLPTLMGLAAQGIYREDVWAPGRPIRDEKGVQVAAMGLRRLAPPK